MDFSKIMVGDAFPFYESENIVPRHILSLLGLPNATKSKRVHIIAKLIKTRMPIFDNSQVKPNRIIASYIRFKYCYHCQALPLLYSLYYCNHCTV